MRNDEKNLKKLAAIRDKNQYIHTARELIEELEKTLQDDLQQRGILDEAGWDEAGLIAEARGN
jgi:hypothetical protein